MSDHFLNSRVLLDFSMRGCCGGTRGGVGIPSGAKAHVDTAESMYGLKPVPFKVTDRWFEAFRCLRILLV